MYIRITKIPFNKNNIYLFIITIIFYTLLLGPGPLKILKGRALY
jgi:hypothetical protein